MTNAYAKSEVGAALAPVTHSVPWIDVQVLSNNNKTRNPVSVNTSLSSWRATTVSSSPTLPSHRMIHKVLPPKEQGYSRTALQRYRYLFSPISPLSSLHKKKKTRLPGPCLQLRGGGAQSCMFPRHCAHSSESKSKETRKRMGQKCNGGLGRAPLS